MAQYYNDFSTETIGEAPADGLLKRDSKTGDYTVQDVNGEVKLVYYALGSTSIARGFAYPLQCRGTVRIKVQLRDMNQSAPASGRIVAYASDSPDAEYGIIMDSRVNRLQLYKRVDGGYGALGYYNTTISASNFYNIIFEVTPSETQGGDNLLKAKVWTEGTEEPENWSIESVNNALDLTSSPQYEGWAGHVGFDDEATILYNSIAIATEGDPLPSSLAPTPTTELTFVFSAEPVGLDASHINVPWATKGELQGTGTTRVLPISDIQAESGSLQNVYISSPDGFSVVPSVRQVQVFA